MRFQRCFEVAKTRYHSAVILPVESGLHRDMSPALLCKHDVGVRQSHFEQLHIVHVICFGGRIDVLVACQKQSIRFTEACSRGVARRSDSVRARELHEVFSPQLAARSPRSCRAARSESRWGRAPWRVRRDRGGRESATRRAERAQASDRGATEARAGSNT